MQMLVQTEKTISILTLKVLNTSTVEWCESMLLEHKTKSIHSNKKWDFISKQAKKMRYNYTVFFLWIIIFNEIVMI